MFQEVTNDDDDTDDDDVEFGHDSGYGSRYGSSDARPCILFLDSLNMHYAGRIGDYLRK